VSGGQRVGVVMGTNASCELVRSILKIAQGKKGFSPRWLFIHLAFLLGKP